MPRGPFNPVIRHLRRVALAREGRAPSDGQLLEQFITGRDEAAFEALVRRHGPMVLGVCRRIMGNLHDAEDAFQASFLVLARKASAVVPREAVGNWLYGVAYRTARRARAVMARRAARERRVEEMPHPSTKPPDTGAEIEHFLDRALDALPDKYRLPLVLCELEGRPRKEVARQLNLPEGTLSSRLATARKKLAARMRRHGLIVPGALLAPLLPHATAKAGVEAGLVLSTVRAGIQAAEGFAATPAVSARVAVWSQAVLKTMFLSKIKFVAPVLVIIAALGGIASYAVHAPAPGAPGELNSRAALAVQAAVLGPTGSNARGGAPPALHFPDGRPVRITDCAPAPESQPMPPGRAWGPAPPTCEGRHIGAFVLANDTDNPRADNQPGKVEVIVTARANGTFTIGGLIAAGRSAGPAHKGRIQPIVIPRGDKPSTIGGLILIGEDPGPAREDEDKMTEVRPVAIGADKEAIGGLIPHRSGPTLPTKQRLEIIEIRRL
jgi:RNA polymerase sigma factor (sigma-70 family)